MDKRNYNSLKLADFGLSTRIEVTEMAKDSCGTVKYMAPEQAKRSNYSKSVDIWSCGMILYILL